jgi:hypothetical protein
MLYFHSRKSSLLFVTILFLASTAISSLYAGGVGGGGGEYRQRVIKLDPSWQPNRLWSELSNFDRMIYVYNLYVHEFTKKKPNAKLQEEALKVLEIMSREAKKERTAERAPYFWYVRQG